MRYRNLKTGREYERPAEDEWLEASSGWERIDEPAPAPAGKDWPFGDAESASADNEEEDD